MPSRSNVDKKNNSGDDFEVLDVRDSAAEGADSFLRFIQKYISEGSNPKQLAIGGVSGWISGYIAMKVGKTIAVAVGGSLILLQIANHKGYIKINWAKVNKDLEGASKKLAQTRSDPSIPDMLDKAANYLDEQAERAGRVLRKKKSSARRWYHRFFHDQTDLSGSETFCVGFIGGSLVGVLSGLIL